MYHINTATQARELVEDVEQASRRSSGAWRTDTWT